ncbi:hypothetical protein G7B40_005875 [Aetokthonos hydrillicola Thurmond2011]|jgi:SSS family solute:Na+ symporter|uniref:Uncharacterized protein n=1 Tax=Aetokthonos hydrillicola Thurmond2011 TaxID=2712845 RepID=A0AAP5I5D3_9CYAN|nr:hypothetical protein [Aetokthonos hydrillicola]MBO3463527.1 hypothetical protein [Aetokthonos hydrillicola CCALA 1050]MBW4588852.1 hypothetical protein [Aetokthonos hydrillicola CCALA 1050]MDR9894099.1 hypothetical protein [Aetokthonos hydrillicola Thurmond2011]
MAQNSRLGAFSLATVLVSAHYGLGFLLGTAEKSLTVGFASSLYAVCLALGTIALVGLAKFYWTKQEQIWTLLGLSYGSGVKVLVGFMSWSSLIGIEAVQIISGAFILKVLGIPTLQSMFVLTILFMLVSLLPLEKVSWIFRALLVVNFLALVYGLCMLHGLPDYVRSPIEFTSSLEQVSLPSTIGIALSTILLIILDMRYQQFIVQAKDVQTLYKACVLAAIALFLLAFLPSSIVIASLKAGILPPDIDGKETLPFILSWIGGGTDKPLGIFLIGSLLLPAIGVGSSILRVQSKTILDFNILPVFKFNRFLVVVVNASLSLVVALKGGTIITLIVFFYSAYVGAVFIPFVAYLMAETGGYTFSVASVRSSLIVGSVAAMSSLILTLINPSISIFGSPELNILGMGVLFGLLSLLVGQVIEKYLVAFDANKEEI